MRSSVLAKQGSISTLLPAEPPPSDDFSYTLPAGYRYQIMCVRFRITTDVNVANRYAGLVLTNTGIHTLYIFNSTAIAASNAVMVNFWTGLEVAGSVAVNRLDSPLPTPLYLEGGTTIGSDVRQIQAADQVDQIQIYTRFWPVLNT